MSKTMVPEVRFKGFSDDWEQHYFFDLIDKTIDFRGRTPKKLGLDWSESGYLALSAVNVKKGYIDYDADAHYGDEKLYNKWMKSNELHKGQVLFTTEAPMGNVAQIPDDKKYILSQRTIAFEINSKMLVEDFLAVLLSTPNTFNKLLSLSSGGTAKGVSQKSLTGLKIVTPDNLEEQKYLGIIIKKINKVITLQQQQLDLYTKLKKGLLQKLFPKDGEKVPEIRFADFSGNWEQHKLKDLGEIQTGSTPSTSNKNNYSDCGMMWVTPSDINSLLTSNTTKKLSSLGQSSARIAKKGSVLVTCIASIGKNTLITEDASFNQQINSLTPSSRNNSYFLLTQSALWSRKMKYIAASGTMQIINKKDFSNIETYVPNSNEQNKLGLFFKKLDNSITQRQERIKNLKILKKYLLQKLFI